MPIAPANVVITGAGSGLGRTLALEFVRRGYSVFGTASSDAQIDELAKTSEGRAQLVICDITDETQVKSFATEVTVRTDRAVGLLISNAGTLTPGPLEAVCHLHGLVPEDLLKLEQVPALHDPVARERVPQIVEADVSPLLAGPLSRSSRPPKGDRPAHLLACRCRWRLSR